MPQAMYWAKKERAPLAQIRGLLLHGQRVHVDHQKDAVVLILHRDPVPDGPDVVPDGEVPRRLDPREDDGLGLLHGAYLTQLRR